MNATPPYSYRRILRRETHSPRSTLAITVASTLIVLCLYCGIEIVLMMLGRPALIAAPQNILTALSQLGSAPTAVPLATGILLMLLGILLLVGALTPGRRARHQIPSNRAAVVVDDDVIAAALARHAAHAGNTNPANTIVSLFAHRAIVRLTPTSGTPVQSHAVHDAVAAQLAAFELHPPVRAAVIISTVGKVGV